MQLTEELDRATALIMGLQSENEASLERERTTRHQAAAEGQFAEQQQLHTSRLSAANQVLQDRLRVMESRLLESDKVRTTRRSAFGCRLLRFLIIFHLGKDVALENRLMTSERRRKDLTEQKRFLAGRLEHGSFCQKKTVSAISKFR